MLGCGAGMTRSMGLHRGYAGCHRHRSRHRGDFRAAGVCGFIVAGATGRGCGSCAGLAGAGSGAEMCSLAGAHGVAVVTARVVSVGLTLHS